MGANASNQLSEEALEALRGQTELDFSNKQLKSLKDTNVDLSNLISLQILKLSHNALIDLDGIGSLAPFPLHELDIRYSFILMKRIANTKICAHVYLQF